jgi:hypothetical protein
MLISGNEESKAAKECERAEMYVASTEMDA